MVILGLDPGSGRTGYGVVRAEGSELRCLRSGVLRPPRGETLARRLHALYDGLRTLMTEVRPEAVALEESFVGRHARAALVLGHARGALIVAALSQGVPVFEYAPRRIKLAATGVGGASKEQVQAMVRRLIVGVPEDLSLDESDALAVAVCHAHRMSTVLEGDPAP